MFLNNQQENQQFMDQYKTCKKEYNDNNKNDAKLHTIQHVSQLPQINTNEMKLKNDNMASLRQQCIIKEKAKQIQKASKQHQDTLKDSVFSRHCLFGNKQEEAQLNEQMINQEKKRRKAGSQMMSHIQVKLMQYPEIQSDFMMRRYQSQALKTVINMITQLEQMIKYLDKDKDVSRKNLFNKQLQCYESFKTSIMDFKTCKNLVDSYRRMEGTVMQLQYNYSKYN